MRLLPKTLSVIMYMFLTIIYFALFILAFPAIFILLKHFWYMNQNIIGKYSGLLSVLVLGMPSQFNEVGNAHRKKFLVMLPVVLVLFVMLFFLSSYLGIG